MKNSKRTFPEIVSSNFLLSVMYIHNVMLFVTCYLVYVYCIIVALCVLPWWVLDIFYRLLELWFITWLIVLLPVLLWWLWAHFTVKSRFWYISILFHLMKWMTLETWNNITMIFWQPQKSDIMVMVWQGCQCSPGQRFHQMWVSSLAVHSSTAS